MIKNLFNLLIVFVVTSLTCLSPVRACDIVFGDGFGYFDITLIHQWKFNEVGGSVLKDEICGGDASIIENGPNNAVVLNGSVYVGGGDKDLADYIQLPDDILSGLQTTTIEIWAVL